MYVAVLIVYFAHHLIALTPLLDTLSPSSLPLSLFLSLSMTPSPQLRSNLALATTLLALFAVNAEAAANMCKNPADLIPEPDMCTTHYNKEIARHLHTSWDSVTCAELCGNAAAVQHMHGYPTCCGGEYCNGTPCPGNAKLLCHNSDGTCDPSATNAHAAAAGPSSHPDTWLHPDVASCMKTGSGTNGARTSGTIADCDHIGLCKNDNDFTPEARGTGAAANCKDGLQYLLSKFQEAGSVSDLAWANVTCSDIESKTYQDAGSTETKKMADTLEGWSSFCCGGKDKMKLPCSLSSSSFSFAPDLAVNLVLAASTVSLLQVLSGW